MIEYEFYQFDNILFGEKGCLNFGKHGREIIFSGFLNHINQYSINKSDMKIIAKFKLKSWK